MQLEQSFTLPFARAAVWPAFADVAMLVACMPGAALKGEPRGVEGGADIDLIFTVKLGPITGAFLGNGAVRRDDSAFGGSFSGHGADRKSGSRVKGEAKFTATEAGANDTRVDVIVDYSLSGSLAQFSRGAIVKELAAALTRDFSANLRQQIAAQQAASQPPSAASSREQAHQTSAGLAAAATLPPQVHTTPLNAGRLFWRVLWAHIAGWFGRKAP